jgi:hypothetical protein
LNQRFVYFAQFPRANNSCFIHLGSAEPVGEELVDSNQEGSARWDWASYEIIGRDAEWRVHHDGKAENVYETKEAAFEAAVAAASLALRQGHEVRVAAPGRGLASGSNS